MGREEGERAVTVGGSGEGGMRGTMTGVSNALEHGSWIMTAYDARSIGSRTAHTTPSILFPVSMQCEWICWQDSEGRHPRDLGFRVSVFGFRCAADKR